MTAHSTFWGTLDLERTNDASAIRRAYAKRLKQTDVEADPEAFISLREALERALAYAREVRVPEPSLDGKPPRDERPPNDLTPPLVVAPGGEGVPAVRVEEPGGRLAPQPRIAADAGPAGADTGAALPLPPDERARTGLSPATLRRAPPEGSLQAFSGGAPVDEHTVRDERFRRMQDLLFCEEPPALEEIGQLASEILADPHMANLKFAAEVEAWMAEIICAASPRSDPVIAEAVPYFGWDADFGKLDQPPRVAAIVHRRRGLLFLDHVSRPGHEYHGAWRELTRPEEGTSWNRWFIGDKVRNLLAVIRDKYPAAEDGLNPYRVALWEGRAADAAGEYEWLGIWGFFLLLLFPPGAMLLAFLNHNAAWFRAAVSIWALLWTMSALAPTPA